MIKVVDNEGNVLEYLGEENKLNWHIYRNCATLEPIMLLYGPKHFKDYAVIEEYKLDNPKTLKELAKKQLLSEGYPEELLK